MIRRGLATISGQYPSVISRGLPTISGEHDQPWVADDEWRESERD